MPTEGGERTPAAARRLTCDVYPLRTSYYKLLTVGLVALAAAGCSNIPTSGPSVDEVTRVPQSPDRGARSGAAIQVVDVDARVARQLLAQRRTTLFSDAFGLQPPASLPIGPGDVVEISIWEAPPATLFGGGSVDPRNPSTVRATTLPEQVVDREGFVMVPFAGRVKAAGLSPQDVQATIRQNLKGKANQPEVLVRLLRTTSTAVTVVGEVTNSLRLPLTAGGERVLDALASAGGVRQPVGKMTLQLSRGGRQQALPLETIIRDPRQNVPLQPGDVVTALFQPLSFTALGATGKNEEIPFEAQGISLAQALGRSGGVIDGRANPQGVFIFRLESEDALDWPHKPVATTPDGLVPVVYRVDLRDPASFFVMQGFPMASRDVIYVSNAPAVELQKFLNILFSVIYPLSATQSLLQ